MLSATETNRDQAGLLEFDPEEPIRILLVEDTEAEAFLFRQYIREIDESGLSVEVTTDFKEAVKALGTGDFDIAFVDYFLGAETGTQLIRAAGGRICPTPLVLLTGHSGRKIEIDAIRAGAIDFVDKNFLSPELLRRVIRNARFNHNLARQLIFERQRYSELAESALQTNGQMSNFLAETNHELRTPLNAIMGFSELIMNQELGPMEGSAANQYVGYARDIHWSSLRLLSQIDNLLELSRFFTGSTETDRVPTPVDRIAFDLVRLMTQRARETGVRLETKVEDGLPKVLVDWRLILQALVNVVSNAIRVSPEGERIDIRFEQEGQDLAIRVRDFGPGIPREEVESLLVPFGKRSPFTTRPEGAGLGLLLAKSIAERHQGSLSIESEVGAGTTVIFRLPLNLRRLVRPHVDDLES